MAYSGGYESIAHLGRGTWYSFGQTSRNRIEQAILALRPLVAPGAECTGAEWWIRIGRAEEAKDWHFDLDETQASESGVARHPIWASVFYLGKTGGATLVTDQIAADGRVDQGVSPEKPSSALAITPRANHFVVFPGSLYHCVLPGAPEPGSRRMTLLINWWDRPPAVYADSGAAPNLPVLAPVRSHAVGTGEPRELRLLEGAEMERVLQEAESCGT